MVPLQAGDLDVLVVLPTYDEAENVAPLIEQLFAADARIHVLVVDDASPDGTGDIVAQIAETEPRVHLLRRAGKLGLGSAYLAGFRAALDDGYRRVVTMDCDFSHSPSHLSAVIDGTDSHALSIGSRYVRGGGIRNWPWYRRFLSWFANRYTRLLLRLSVRDCTSGFRCYRRDVLESVDPFGVQSSGYSFLEEMVFRVHRAGFSIGETPIVFEDRRGGVSKIDRTEIWRAAWHVLSIALRPPPRPSVVRPTA